MTCRQFVTPKESTKAYHFTQIEALSNIFKDLKIHVHMKVMDTFNNGTVTYAFYFKKNLKSEHIKFIEKNAMVLLNSSIFLMSFYVDHKLTCEEFKYA